MERNNLLFWCAAALTTLPGMCLMTPEFVCVSDLLGATNALRKDINWSFWNWTNWTKKVQCAALTSRKLEETKWPKGTNDQTPVEMKPVLSPVWPLTVIPLMVHVNTWDTVHYASSSPSRWDRTLTAEGDLRPLNQHSWQSNFARLHLSVWKS